MGWRSPLLSLPRDLRVIQTRFFYIFTVFLTLDCVSQSERGADFPAVWQGNLLNFVRLEAISSSVFR